MARSTEEIVTEALEAANKKFTETDGGFPFGFAMVKGLDGRRKETKVAKQIPGISVSRDGYHGTTLDIDTFGGQPMGPKVSGYREFLRVCQENGLFEDATIWSHAD